MDSPKSSKELSETEDEEEEDVNVVDEVVS